jgi:hypothetical protein
MKSSQGFDSRRIQVILALGEARVGVDSNHWAGAPGRAGPLWPSRRRVASSAMVGASNKARMGSSRSKVPRIRLARRVARSE